MAKSGKTKKVKQDDDSICQNRRAHHDYMIEDKLEAGLVLTGTEVKACRARKAHLNEAYVRVINDEAFLIGAHIAEYEQGNRFNHEPARTRKLLLKRREIDTMHRRVKREGYTAVPLALYFKGGYVKIRVGIARGKKEFDRRETLKAREVDREMRRALRSRNR